MTKTIQCAAWNICCARPHERKRAISGSAASARSSRHCSRRGRGPDRMRACSIAAAAPAPTSSCSIRFGRAYGFDLTEIGLRIGREAGRTRLARATVTAAPFPSAAFDIVTSFDVLYSLDDARRTRGDRGDVPPAEAGRLRHRQRRGDARAARRSFGAQPRGAALQPRRAARRGWSAPASRSSASPTRTPRCFRRWRSRG